MPHIQPDHPHPAHTHCLLLQTSMHTFSNFYATRRSLYFPIFWQFCLPPPLSAVADTNAAAPRLRAPATAACAQVQFCRCCPHCPHSPAFHTRAHARALRTRSLGWTRTVLRTSNSWADGVAAADSPTRTMSAFMAARKNVDSGCRSPLPAVTEQCCEKARFAHLLQQRPSLLYVLRVHRMLLSAIHRLYAMPFSTLLRTFSENTGLRHSDTLLVTTRSAKEEGAGS